MKYKIRNNQALDFCMSVEMRDCREVSLYSPLYDNKANVKEVYDSDNIFTNIDSLNSAELDSLAFINDDLPGMSVIKVGGGAYHYFMIQKEHVNGESFFRIFQAYDEEYSLQDWLQSDRNWNSAAKENFGKGQWLSLEKMQEFMKNLKNIVSSRDEKAYQDNFGVPTKIYDNVFISVNTFLKKANCQETITLEAAQLEPTITPTPSSQTEATHSSSTVNISMFVLGGFIAAAGITAVAIAFTLLNVATFGGAGLIVGGIGVVALLSGVGLFATGVHNNRQNIPQDSLDLVSLNSPELT